MNTRLMTQGAVTFSGLAETTHCMALNTALEMWHTGMGYSRADGLEAALMRPTWRIPPHEQAPLHNAMRLNWALKHPDLTPLTMLLHHQPKAAKTSASPYADTPMITAIDTGDATRVKMLLDAGGDITPPFAYEKSYLLYALSKGHIHSADLLHEAGAPLNLSTDGHVHEMLTTMIMPPSAWDRLLTWAPDAFQGHPVPLYWLAKHSPNQRHLTTLVRRLLAHGMKVTSQELGHTLYCHWDKGMAVLRMKPMRPQLKSMDMSDLFNYIRVHDQDADTQLIPLIKRLQKEGCDLTPAADMLVHEAVIRSQDRAQLCAFMASNFKLTQPQLEAMDRVMASTV